MKKSGSEVEENTEWVDRAAYESRANLLDGLITLYRNEMEQIEKAHSRVEERSYGLCLACHEPIEAHRLEVYPAAQFCFDCQDYRERLKNGLSPLVPLGRSNTVSALELAAKSCLVSIYDRPFTM